MKHTIVAFVALFCLACSAPVPLDVPELTDNDLVTTCHLTPAENQVAFTGFEAPMLSYTIYSSGDDAATDPTGWVLCGSYDGRKWVELDRQTDCSFCSRFQPMNCNIAIPSNYTHYKLTFLPTESQTVIAVGDVRFNEVDTDKAWADFTYPAVCFEVLAPQSKGAAIYAQLVQNPEAYIRYHTRQVAEILFYSAADTMNKVGKINYKLEDYAGVSAKSGDPSETTIVYSTQHIEKSAQKSLYKLDYETRGVLFHELVHAYQFEPKGIGTYSTNKEFWACIEGLADAVRTEAGLFDIAALRKPGGHWLDGYKTTGFFLQWLTTKNANALREFHITVRDMEVWSFDKAMKQLFGPEQGIEQMWQEYQNFLLKQPSPTV